MREIIGWMLGGLGVLLGLRVIATSARHRVPPEFDRRSVFQSDYEHHKTLQRVPGFAVLVLLSLGLLILGMCLIGILGGSP
ncbi:MAG: hypothetical protein RDU89_05470 [bacterium]|nr:hypothetical protein [bacterium]